MSELRQRLQEDLSLARGLAEEGRRAPLIGGVLYVVWGAAVFGCLMFNWAVTTRALPVSPWAIPVVWFLGMGAAAVIASGIGARLKTLPGAAGIGNTVSGAVWRAVGLFQGIFATTLFVSLFGAPAWMFGATAGEGRIFAAAFSIFLPVSFGAYSVALAASAAAAKSRMLQQFSLASLALMALTLALIGRSEQLLVGGAGTLLVCVLPGWLLMRRAPKADEPQ
ncbi:MAG: hypothetical protein ABL957_10975 [Parvularculaceae bacterium]